MCCLWPCNHCNLFTWNIHNALKIAYDKFSPFEIWVAAAVYTPIYKGSPSVHCPLRIPLSCLSSRELKTHFKLANEVQLIKFLWHSLLWANSKVFYYYWSVNINEYNVLILRPGHHSVFFPHSNNSVIKIRSIAFVAFWLSSSEGDRKGNCHPGLVVKNDSEVTGSMKDDFYLQSHAATQGSTLSIICLADLLMDFILFSSSFCALYSLAHCNGIFTGNMQR